MCRWMCVSACVCVCVFVCVSQLLLALPATLVQPFCDSKWRRYALNIEEHMYMLVYLSVSLYAQMCRCGAGRLPHVFLEETFEHIARGCVFALRGTGLRDVCARVCVCV